MELAAQPLSSNPHWADVVPVPQDDGPDPIPVRILYTPEFSSAMSYFRAVVLSQEFSPRTLALSTLVISLNSANYSAWHFRRQCIEVVPVDLAEELVWLRDMAMESPKNYQLWHHRRWVIEQLSTTDILAELDIAAQVLALDAKNYHVWSHRQWLLTEFGFWAEELEYTNLLLEQDVKNNSAWNQRYFVIKHLHEEKGVFPISVVSEEIAYSIEKLALATDNQSVWNYMLGVLKAGEYTEEPVTMVEKAAVQLGDVVPALSALVEIHERVDKKKAAGICEQLVVLDQVRAKYWNWKIKALLHTSD